MALDEGEDALMLGAPGLIAEHGKWFAMQAVCGGQGTERDLAAVVEGIP
jgi:hypothetical protein